MKLVIKFLLIFFMLISSVSAVELLVLPVDLLQKKENYYGFSEVSEIVANDVIYNFLQNPEKIKSVDLYGIYSKLNQNPALKQTAMEALNKYTQNNIDYSKFKTIEDAFNAKAVLVISGSVVTNKNSLKRNLWEVLEISTAIDTPYPYRLEISAVLLDTQNKLIMWSNNYSTKISSNNNTFIAKNYVQANEQYEKIKLYSKSIVSPSISQNVTLRFYPKAVRPVLREIDEMSGNVLRFDSKLPEKPKNLKPRENFYGENVYGI